MSGNPAPAPTDRPLTEVVVVGTAGHIDHGKTSLVRALTGVDLDRLPEERRRGITIALGFTHLALPSGRVASLVDVPGHERLVRTMVAGATGLDAVVLCISAVEGVMPQTREHLAILELLQVGSGCVALTMCDLVEEDLAELAEEEVAELVRGTFLESAPIVRTSAHTGMGIEDLKAALDHLPVARRPGAGVFRLPVDRAFVQRGFGVVVTGTCLSGRVDDGDEVVILPQGDRARVRGVQVHGQRVESAHVGLRTALNLAGPEREELPRGTVVAAPRGVAVTSVLDVRYRHLGGAPELEKGDHVRLLAGTAEVMAVADPLDPPGLPVLPGTTRWLQLRCAEPLACLPGDRFVLRRESPVTTLGGGEVVDPWAPRLRARDADEAVAWLERMRAGDRLARLERAGPGGLPVAEAEERLGLPLPPEAVALGDRLLSPVQVDGLEGALRSTLAMFHEEQPLAPGAGRRELLRGRLTVLGPAAFDALVARLVATGELVLEGPRLRLATFAVQLDADQRAQAELLRRRLVDAGWEPADGAALVDGVPQGEALLSLWLARGEVARVAGRFYLRSTLDGLVAQVRDVLVAEGELSPQRFKDLTGLSRRGAIPLLEWLDSEGVTLRVGEVRVARPPRTA